VEETSKISELVSIGGGTEMRKLVIAVAALLTIGAIALIALWYFIGQPMYEPGMVREETNLRAPLAAPDQPGNGSFWQVEADIQLHHFDVGEGRNVVIIHGGPGYPYLEAWGGLDALTDRYRFHYYDQRGCGQSSRPFERFPDSNFYANMTTLEQTLGLGAQIADLERIRRILKDEKLILIGHSFGGLLASLYAAEFPDHLQALILVSPANLLVMPFEGDDLFGSIRARLPQDQKEPFDEFMTAYFDFGNIFSKSESELIAQNEDFANFYAQVMEIATPLPPQGKPGGWMAYGMYFSMGQRHDYRPYLEEVNVPVLVIHGADDLQSEEASRSYSEAFPNAEFLVIDGATHFPFIEQPETFSNAVASFLDNP
jgi:proline iminopeptidase